MFKKHLTLQFSCLDWIQRNSFCPSATGHCTCNTLESCEEVNETDDSPPMDTHPHTTHALRHVVKQNGAEQVAGCSVVIIAPYGKGRIKFHNAFVPHPSSCLIRQSHSSSSHLTSQSMLFLCHSRSKSFSSWFSWPFHSLCFDHSHATP